MKCAAFQIAGSDEATHEPKSRAPVAMTNDEARVTPQSLMNRMRSPLFRHWVIESLIRHSSFGLSHSLACATQVHGPNVCQKRKEALRKPARRSADAHIRGAMSQSRELADMGIRALT